MTIDDVRCSKLSEICRLWGGGFHLMPRSLWHPFLDVAPFAFPVAMDWGTSHVFADRPGAWPYVIHEMAHCFAMREPPAVAGPTEPVGWQLMMACHLDADAGRDWISFFRTHGMNVGKDFRDMTDSEVSNYLTWAIGRDLEAGLLSSLRPVSVRRGSLVSPVPLPDVPKVVRYGRDEVALAS